MSAYADARDDRGLRRALQRDAIPLVVRGGRVASSASATILIEGGSLSVSGRALVRAYGGWVRAGGTATVLAEGRARVRLEEDAVAILVDDFEGTLRVDDRARVISVERATTVDEFCRLQRIEHVAYVGAGPNRTIVGEWFEELSGLGRADAVVVPRTELTVSGGGHALQTRDGALLDVHATSARLVPTEGPELVIEGDAREAISGPARVRVGDAARVTVRGPAFVNAWGRAHVEATDATVVAVDSARVVARGRSFVRAYDATKVEARDDAVVLASEYSRVYAFERAAIETEFWAVVEAHDDARVRAFDGSTIYAEGRSRVRAAGHAVVRVLSKDAEVVLGPGALRLGAP